MTYQSDPDDHGAVLAALADGTRREIFERLRTGPRTVGELAAGLPVSRPAVSQHLKVLREAGLVSERSQGRQRVYALRRAGLNRLRRWLDGFWDDVLAAYAEALDREDDGGGDGGSDAGAGAQEPDGEPHA